MIKLTIKEKEFILAEDWSDVNYGQYIEMTYIQADEHLDELEMTIKLIANMSDKPEECAKSLMNDMDMQDLNDLAKHMMWIETEFIEQAKKAKKKTEFFIDGRKFVVKSDFHKLTNGEYVTIQTLLADKIMHPHEIVLGTILREEINGKQKDFDPDDFYEIVNDLKFHINLMDFYNYVTFFLRGAKKSKNKPTSVFSVQKLPKKD